MFNMTEIPEIFSNLFGLDLEPTGALITIFGIMAITLFLALMEVDFTLISLPNLVWLAFTVFIGWFDFWIFVIITLFVAVFVGRKAVTIIKGGNT